MIDAPYEKEGSMVNTTESAETVFNLQIDEKKFVRIADDLFVEVEYKNGDSFVFLGNGIYGFKH